MPDAKDSGLPFRVNAEGEIVISVDLGLYSHDALLKTAYRFTGRCDTHLGRAGETVHVRLRAHAQDAPTRALAGAFMNELLDQTLRERIARETEPVRDLIMAHALSRTGLVAREFEDTLPPEETPADAG